MCPFCLANLALIATGAISTGGLATAVTNKFRARKKMRQLSANFQRRIKSRARGARVAASKQALAAGS